MIQFTALIKWHRAGQVFLDNQYSRAHVWEFDGGVIVAASSSPHVVPVPLSMADNVDPEEAFIAALSSCHMLVFLSIAAKKKYVVDDYHDQALGVLATDESGNMAITEVRLRPKVTFAGERQPSLEQLQKMHHLAHQHCFIANSVKTQVTIEVVS
ncbi:OsmC family protein [Shewanella sp. NIFS-20-20]|uniref:OsmC family protein n=1 Tax=Shewanella sp. NIFS-20-20 TaxID=2853806 RepID=UPI001C472A93|nr:OsmC family protein [Shewanella sp. NIFS-20-20]MBV7315533.1 OsmC family protein [Shewanella sp. NIFS-20-20]